MGKSKATTSSTKTSTSSVVGSISTILDDSTRQETTDRLNAWLSESTTDRIINTVWDYAIYYVSNKHLGGMMEKSKYTLSIFEDKINNIVDSLDMYDKTDPQGLLWKLLNDKLDIADLGICLDFLDSEGAHLVRDA